MAAFVGTPTGGPISPASVWTVSVPAGAAGQSQALILSYKAKTSSPGTLAGWDRRLINGHSGYPGAVVVYTRKLASSASASTANVSFSAAAQGSYVCQTVDGDYKLVTTPVQQDGTPSVSLPAYSVTAADTAVLEVWASAEFPRSFVTAAGGVSTTHQPSMSGPGLTIGRRVVGAGSVTGAPFAPDDPNIGGTDGAYSGTEDWTGTIGFAVLFESATVSTAVDIVGTPSQATLANISSYALLVPAGNNGDTQIVAFNVPKTVSVSIPSGWNILTMVGGDEHAGQLTVLDRKLTANRSASTETFSFGAPTRGSIAALTVRGLMTDMTVNATTQSEFNRSWTPPFAMSFADGSLALSIVGSANFDRTATPGVGVTEIVDQRGAPSLAIGKRSVESGAVTLPAWTPADGGDPSRDGGDAFRGVTITFASTATTTPVAGTTVQLVGGLRWIASPDGLSHSLLTSNSVRISWIDRTTSEAGFRYQYRMDNGQWPLTHSDLPANSTAVNLQGLQSGQRYRFIVLATEGGHHSAWSAEYVFTTLVSISRVDITTPSPASVLGATIPITVQTVPPEANARITWVITGGVGISLPLYTDSTGKAVASIYADRIGDITAVATIGSVPTSLLIIRVGASSESLILSVSPGRVEKGGVALANVTGGEGGRFWLGRPVSIVSSNHGVAGNPFPGVMQPTHSGGSSWTFTLPGVNPGTTTLTAYIDGVASNPVTMVVANPPAPPVYVAGVATHCAVHIEAPLAAALRPKIRRMTDADQQMHHPGDDGFKYANAVASKEIVFFTKDRIAKK